MVAVSLIMQLREIAIHRGHRMRAIFAVQRRGPSSREWCSHTNECCAISSGQRGHQAVNCVVGTVDWKKKFAKQAKIVIPVSFRPLHSAILAYSAIRVCQARRAVEYNHFQLRIKFDFEALSTQAKRCVGEWRDAISRPRRVVRTQSNAGTSVRGSWV